MKNPSTEILLRGALVVIGWVLALPAFRALNAPEKTLMYDTFLVVGGFIAGIAQAGQETNDEQLKAQAKSMARDALARFGVGA